VKESVKMKAKDLGLLSELVKATVKVSVRTEFRPGECRG
jgi:hypothetical protein